MKLYQVWVTTQYGDKRMVREFKTRKPAERYLAENFPSFGELIVVEREAFLAKQ